MEIIGRPIADVVVLRPRRIADTRGYFAETYNRQRLADIGISNTFVQDNESLSAHRGTIRGLHFQLPPAAQAKLVRVLSGRIFDVVADMRSDSPSYGRWASVVLTAAEGEQLFVPAGFAHGFCTLEPDTVVAYKVDRFYDAACDSGIVFSDPTLAVTWPVPANEAIVSDKDKQLGALATFASPFRCAGM